jgi:hypothetical protein
MLPSIGSFGTTLPPVNEPYRPQPGSPPHVPPPSQNRPPGPAPESPPQQRSPVGQPTEQVVRVWTKGRGIPLLGSACALVILALLAWATIRPPGDRGFINLDVIAFVVFVFGIVLAFRRKATLTTRHLIVRRLFRTRELPLHEIVNVYTDKRTGRSNMRMSSGWTDLVWGLLVDPFLPKPVKIELTNHRSCRTSSFGWATQEAMVLIAETAKAAGSPIDI